MAQDAKAKKAQDRKWVRALRRGDFEAFDHIFHAYRKRIFAFLYRLVWDERDAELLMQEVFLQLWKGAMLIDDDLSLVQTLYRIGKNVFVEYLRGEREDNPAYTWGKSLPNPTKLEPLHEVACTDCDETRKKMRSNREFLRCARRAMRDGMIKLGPWHRLVIVLLIYQGLSVEEVAQILDSTPAKVRQRAARAEMELASFLCLEEAMAQ